MKRNSTFKERVSYWFDGIMSRGTGALVGLLFLVTLVVVLVVAALSFLLSPAQAGGSLGSSVWQSFMRVLDAGNVAGDFESGSWLFVLMMVLATVCGLFVTSILIGIINTAFENRLSSLRKGNSRVLESGHTLILGFSEHIHSIVGELVIANENAKDPCIVILSGLDKEEAEDSLRARVPDTKNTRVICRCGSVSSFGDLENVGIGSCRSVIVLSDDDFSIIKTVLAASTMLEREASSAHITVVVNDEDNLDAVRIAGGERVEALYCGRTIARIIAQTCRQPGLSVVYRELFAFEGNEIYMERAPLLEGRPFGDAVMSYPNASAIGIDRLGKVMINPEPGELIQPDDRLILIAEDDGAAAALPAPLEADASRFAPVDAGGVRRRESVLVLGYNELAPDMLGEIDDYIESASSLTVATPYEEAPAQLAGMDFKNAQLSVICDDIYDRASLERVMAKEYDYIVVLSDCAEPGADRDARTLTLLLQLRDIARKTGREFVIVSQMESVENQTLATCARVNDFVVGSSYVSLLMTQISENRELARVFEILLTSEGNEIYIRPAERYVAPGADADFAALTASALRYRELCIGYKRRLPDGSWEIRVNPPKSERIRLFEGDGAIVLSED